MHFNVSQFTRELSGFAKRYEVDEWIALVDEDRVRVSGTVRFVKTSQGIWVTARIHSAIVSECGRCLDEYTQPVDVRIEEEAVPKRDFVTGTKLLGDQEVDQRLMIDEDYTLELTEATRQYIALELPLQPLCMADCKGLCATCGVNRNREDCTCDQVQRDSRWGALLDMMPAIETIETSKN